MSNIERDKKKAACGCYTHCASIKCTLKSQCSKFSPHYSIFTITCQRLKCQESDFPIISDLEIPAVTVPPYFCCPCPLYSLSLHSSKTEKVELKGQAPIFIFHLPLVLSAVGQLNTCPILSITKNRICLHSREMRFSPLPHQRLERRRAYSNGHR